MRDMIGLTIGFIIFMIIISLYTDHKYCLNWTWDNQQHSFCVGSK